MKYASPSSLFARRGPGGSSGGLAARMSSPPEGAHHQRRLLGTSEVVVATGAVAGSVGLITNSIDLGSTINNRLPFESPVFAGTALLVIVGVPMTIAAIAAWRGAEERDHLAMGAGVLLMGWIVVETSIIQAFSWLQPAFLIAGAAISFAGYRQWHLTWGATDEEVGSVMPGDEIDVPQSFIATRSITIGAPPRAVWPWLVQVGRGRGGFYSYDRLDNGGRPSATEVLNQFQDCTPGVIAAPMASHPSPLTSFVVASARKDRFLVWAKNDSVWSWRLTPADRGTRLTVRLRTGPVRAHPVRSLIGAVLLEVGDFPMMHKMLRGIQERAESLTR